MIQPQDWEVILRLPRPMTLVYVLALIATPTLLIMLPVLGYSYLARGRIEIQRRDLVRLFILLVTAFSAIVLCVGISSRMRQAACWRLGPEAMPTQDRDHGQRMPPQGVEGYY